LTGPRRLAGFSLVHLLVLGAIAELSINRLAVGALPPTPPGETSPEHTALFYVGLFVQYFASTLAIGVIAVRAAGYLRTQGAGLLRAAGVARGALFALFAAVAAVAVATPPSPATSFVLQSACAAAVLSILVAALVRRHDWGVIAGILLFATPLLVHYGGAFAGRVLLSEEQVLDIELVERVKRAGQWAVCVAAVLSPYCLAPRPVARALIRPLPLIIALLVAALGALLIRSEFPIAALIARDGIGIDLGPGISANQMGLYLLSLATVAWTLASCAIASAAPRRQVALGIALILLGGYGYAWPLQYLLTVVGLATIADAAAGLREAEAGIPVPRTPPIDDGVWQTYVTGLVTGLRHGEHTVNALTMRGDHDLTTSILVTERHGVPIKLRIERLSGSVFCLDVICGREVDERRRATFTLAARPDRLVDSGTHPEPPPSGAAVRTGDESFDQRFRQRGDGAALAHLLDDGLRARAAASLDGWVAWWDGQSLRHRVYPGAGAPFDHPIPISDLALRRGGSADRLVGVVDLLAEIAGHGLAPAEPSALVHETAPDATA
jgi:hypothetical protein